MKLQYRVGDSNASDGEVRPQFNLVNTGGTSVPLSELTIRYWYTRDGGATTQQFNCDYAQIGCAEVNASFANASADVSADSYLELGFSAVAGEIPAGGQSGEIQTRFNKSDWSIYNEADDYSYAASKTAFADHTQVTLYRNGALVWGAEPGISGTEPTPTPTATSATPSPTPTVAGDGLKLQYRVGDSNASDGEVRPQFNLVNTGGTSVPLSELTIRYWYTRDGGATTQQFNCDYAQIGCAEVNASFANASADVSADSYLELGFSAVAGEIPAGGQSGEIQTRFNKSDWSTYNEADDYSYAASKTAFADHTQVTLYRNGALVWGAEPGISGTEPTPTPTATSATPSPTPTSALPAPSPTSVSTSLSTSGTELITEWGFENDLSPFHASGSTALTRSSNAYSGDFALLFGDPINGGSGSVQSNYVPVEPNTTYTVSFWAKRSAVATRRADQMLIGVSTLRLDPEVGLPRYLDTDVAFTVGKDTTAYTHYTRAFTTPAETTHINLVLNISSGLDALLLDDVRLVRGDAVLAGPSCGRRSPMSCEQVRVSLPYRLEWDASVGGLVDSTGRGTGFTMADPPSTRLSADGTPPYASAPGYEPSKIAVDSAADALKLTSTAGNTYRDPSVNPGSNTQLNALGFGFAASEAVQLRTTLHKPDFTVSTGTNGQQAGLWFGLNENNYAKLVLVKGDNGAGRVQLTVEQYGAASTGPLPLELNSADISSISGSTLELVLELDPVAGVARGFYRVDGGTLTAVSQNGTRNLAVPPSFFAGIDHDVSVGTGAISFGGILASHGAADQPITVVFDRFAIELIGGTPFDTDTLKWDPMMAVLRKDAGITLEDWNLDELEQGIIMTLSASSTEGQAALAELKVGSKIASDISAELGGPFARVTEVRARSTTSVTVNTVYMPFNELLLSGSLDLSGAAAEAYEESARVMAAQSGPVTFPAEGYESVPPTSEPASDLSTSSTLDNVNNNQQEGPSGVSLANKVYLPTVFGQGDELILGGVTSANTEASVFPLSGGITPPPAPPEADGKPFGRAHLTMDNFQFLWDPEKGMGFEMINVRLGLLGIMPGETVARDVPGFGFGVLGTATADQARLFLRPRFNVNLDKNNFKFDVGSEARIQAHFQVRGVAAGLWFLDFPRELQPKVRWAIPTPIGVPIPTTARLGVQGYVISVGVGGYNAETGFEVIMGKQDTEVKPFGVQQFGWDRGVDNMSMAGVAIEPYLKVELFTFDAIDEKATKLLKWATFGLGARITDPIAKFEGLVVLTFSARPRAFLKLFSWKDRNRPIYNPSVCIQPVIKAEALPNFPIKMTFELQFQGNDYCLYNKGYLYYDMKLTATPADTKTGIAKLDWDVPIISERSNIPNNFPAGPDFANHQIESTNIADALFDAGFRRNCVIYKKRFQLDPVLIKNSMSCDVDDFEVQLDESENSATYVLRFYTEYVVGDTVPANSEELSLTKSPPGVYSEKSVVVQRGRPAQKDEQDTITISHVPRGSDLGEVTLECTLITPPAHGSVSFSADCLKTLYQPTRGYRGMDQFVVNYREKVVVFGEEMIVADYDQPVVVSAAEAFDYHVTMSACPKPREIDVLAGVVGENGTAISIAGVSPAQLGSVVVRLTIPLTLEYTPNGTTGLDQFNYTLIDELGNISDGVVYVELIKCEDPGPGGDGDGDGGGGPLGSGGIWGDPHIYTPDGGGYDSHSLGEFVYARPRTGQDGLTLQVRQELVVDTAFPAAATAMAVKVGDHVVEIHTRPSVQVLLNGEPFTGSYADLGGGASFTIAGNQAQITTSRGRMSVKATAGFLDISVGLPLDGSLEGMFGIPNGDPTDDMRLPDGTTADNALALAEGWRITSRADSLFTYADGEGPETYNKANIYLDQIPSAEEFQPYQDQARALLTNTCAPTEGSSPDQTLIDALALDLYIGIAPASIASQFCSYEVSGLVISSATGEPLPGVAVSLTSSQLQPCTAVTGPDGRYLCEMAPNPNGDVPTVTINATGMESVSLVFPAKAPQGETLAVTGNLTVTIPVLRLTLNTVDPNGATLPNTSVRLYSYRSLNPESLVTTGADGRTVTEITFPAGTTDVAVGHAATAGSTSGNTSNKTLFVTLESDGLTEATVTVTALRLGTPRWKLDHTMDSSPIASETIASVGPDGTIYTIAYEYQRYSSHTNFVRATNPDGSTKWASPVYFQRGEGHDEQAIVIGPDGTLYVSGSVYENRESYGVVYALDPRDGSQRWRFTSPAREYYASSLAVGADGLIYVMLASYQDGGTLYALDPASGQSQLNKSVRLPVDGSGLGNLTIASDGTVYVEGGNKLVAVHNGVVIWSYQYHAYGDCGGSPTLAADGTIYVAFSCLSGDSSSSDFIALNPDGTLKWDSAVRSHQPAIVGADGTVYVTQTGQGLLTAINPADGTVRWTYGSGVEQTNQPRTLPVIGADGLIYIGTSTSLEFGAGGNLAAISPDGQLVRSFITELSLTSTPVMAPDGTVYITTSDDDLMAIPTNSGGLANSSWPSLYRDSQHTGRAVTQ